MSKRNEGCGRDLFVRGVGGGGRMMPRQLEAALYDHGVYTDCIRRQVLTAARRIPRAINLTRKLIPNLREALYFVNG